ncbi:Yae1 family protein [Phanerochaete sordida]|uniref:Protein YAE1 n=1 Tax=Phanerochaete sordida TaxID=48140 RepID=A0A9P3L7Z9_9APHY|nr:Yae1 family protein [Phanerochaete sordida]
MDLDDSPWDDNATSLQDTEWSKLSSDFVNAGYREGITAGKEGALQEGFDEGFAQTGAPLGRNLGLLRGFSSSIASFLSSSSAQDLADRAQLLEEVRAISSALSNVRFSDIVPPDMQAIEHAKEHLEDAEDVVTSEELQEKRNMESLEDLMNRMGAAPSAKQTDRPTAEDVAQLEQRLHALAHTLGLTLPSK